MTTLEIILSVGKTVPVFGHPDDLFNGFQMQQSRSRASSSIPYCGPVLANSTFWLPSGYPHIISEFMCITSFLKQDMSAKQI
uniref:Uncharacterized protein n=1 Tax=Anguilla anguilla TaxID=7936 RepID=A0A0E9QSP9_ANGAN